MMLAAAALAAAWTLAPARASEPDVAPLFAQTYAGVDGKPLALKRFQGKPLIVNFWARWCGPCRKEIPDLVEAGARYRKQGLTVVGVAVEDGREGVADFARVHKIDYPVVVAGTTSGIDLMRGLGNDKGGLPFTVAVDRQGRIVFTKLGPLNRQDIEAVAKKLF